MLQLQQYALLGEKKYQKLNLIDCQTKECSLFVWEFNKAFKKHLCFCLIFLIPLREKRHVRIVFKNICIY